MEIAKRYFTRLKTTGSTLTGLLFNFESPRQVALSVTFGFFLGIFPVVGVTTALCLIAIFSFRLNSLATISMNFLVSPIQLALLYPFWQLGQYLSIKPNEAGYPFEMPEASLSSLSANWTKLSERLLDAVLVWALFSILGGLLFYFILRKMQILRAQK